MRTIILSAVCTMLIAGGAVMLAFGGGKPATPTQAKAASLAPAKTASGPKGPSDVNIAVPVGSPADVAVQLQALHQKRAYEQLSRLIVADRRAASIALLQAIDGVLDANESLKRTAEQAYYGPVTETWNLASMGDNLGPLSEHVRLISQQLKGSTAIVTLQAGENIPLIHAAFDLVDGQWQYRPEPSPAQLTTELITLSRVLKSVGDSIRYGAPFESYFDAFVYRVLPQMAAVLTAHDEEPGKVAAAAGE